jgi:alanine-glyoxylate transaminase/(R)-3-amino-2-methylpropionate-pyruvate transaminase
MGATAQKNWKFNVVQSGVHHAVNPDPYRGAFGSDAEKYARDVKEIIEFGTTGHVAGFISEAIQVRAACCTDPSLPLLIGRTEL